MNKYLFPLYDSEEDSVTIESVQASSLEQAFEKISEQFQLNDLCENQTELEASMEEFGYLVGEVIDIDEI